MGDKWRTLAAQFATTRLWVLAAETYRSRVVVQFLERHIEHGHGSDHHLGESCGAIRIEEPIQGTPNGIVAHVLY